MRARVVLIAAMLAASPATAQRAGTLPPAQRAGSLIAAEPVVDTPAGMQAWRIRYRTTSDRGVGIEATGMLIAPREAVPPRPRRVIAWAHGAYGVVERCALSLSPAFFTATPGLSDAIARGYVVVAPDYPGLGAPGVHPFLVGESAARAILDAARAASGVPGATAGRDIAVWGESQGGHATLWTAARRAYAPDLRLVGAAAAAPPTDLVANLTGGSDPSVRAFLTAFAAYSWSRHYDAPLSTVGSRSTGQIITALARNNCVELGGKPRLGTALGVLTLRQRLRGVDLGRLQPWARIARDNSVPTRNPGVPLLIAQNEGDAIVAAGITHAFTRRVCAAGARVRIVAIAGKGHETSARDSAAATLDWIDARFAGERAPNDCRRV